MIEYFLDDIGIVFYTNMVQYPNVLSAQVIPPELQKVACQQLQAVKEKVPNFRLVKENPILLDITLKQIDGVINFIESKDQSHLWAECIEFNHALDNSRKQKSFETVTPEFRKYV